MRVYRGLRMGVPVCGLVLVLLVYVYNSSTYIMYIYTYILYVYTGGMCIYIYIYIIYYICIYIYSSQVNTYDNPPLFSPEEGSSASIPTSLKCTCATPLAHPSLLAVSFIPLSLSLFNR